MKTFRPLPSSLRHSVRVLWFVQGIGLLAQAPAIPLPEPAPAVSTPAAVPRQVPKVVGGAPTISLPTPASAVPAVPGAPAIPLPVPLTATPTPTTPAPTPPANPAISGSVSNALTALAIPSAATNEGTALPALDPNPTVPVPIPPSTAPGIPNVVVTVPATTPPPSGTNPALIPPRTLPATQTPTTPVATAPTNAAPARPLALPSNFPKPATNIAATARPGLPVVGPAATRPGLPGRPGVPAAAAPATPPISPEMEENNALVDRLRAITDLDEYSEVIKIKQMPLDQFLDIYAKAAKRIVLRGQGLNGQLQVTFVADKKLPREVILQAFDTVLALNQIATIPQGEEFVLVVPSQTASGMGKQFTPGSGTNYNEAFQYVTHIVHVKHVEVKEAVEVMAKFASPQNAQGIVALESTKTIVLRDYQQNVKRMLEVLEKIDVHVDDDFLLEVIPIKYGKVEEIYGTLSSVIGGGGPQGGGGASLNSNRRNTTRSSSVRSSSSYNNNSGGAFGSGAGGNNYGAQQNNLGGAAGGRGGTGFQQRLAGVNRGGAGGAPGAGGAISELLETTSITPDPRSNSLIVYGTKKDIAKLKEVIAKVDTLLAQVLIEGIIMEVSLTDGLNYGLSAGQNPKSFGGKPNVTGGGSVNGNSALNNVSSFLGGGGGTNGTFSTGGGLSYFTKIGPTWNLALNAIASDNRVNIIQQPRIQTTHATEARFFVGSTVAFQQGAYGGISGVSSSYYQRQDVGIDLTVTPYITPDGLVTMEVNQVIEEIAPGSSTEANVPPTTNKREANSTVSVMSGEAILLGGYIRNSKSDGHSGVPLLKDIPFLGKAFSSTSRNGARTELMVLIRPTVLLNPKEAAEYAAKTRQDSAPLRELEDEVKASELARKKAVEKREQHRDSKWWGR